MGPAAVPLGPQDSAHSTFSKCPFLLTQGPAGREISSGGHYLRGRGLETREGDDVDSFGWGGSSLRDEEGLVYGRPHL